MSGTARSICVNGSVDGVSTAAATTEPTTTYRHTESICFEETKPVCPSRSWMTGTWNAGSVLNKSTKTNSKYWSMLHSDSTASDEYPMKNFSAAGVSVAYAK